MSAVAERLLSLDEFYREYEGRRAYLIDGVAHEVTPPNPPHVYGTETLHEILARIVPENSYVREEKPLEIGTDSDPEPDLAVVLGSRLDYRGRHPTAADALLVVEVADTTLATDRRLKLPKYAEAGIREVWVVNLRAGEVEVHRKPAGGRYSDPSVVSRGQAISPLFAPDARVIVGDWAGAKTK